MACALQLQRAGFATTVVDIGDPLLAASHGNAGHIAIEQVDPLASYANVCSVPRRLAVRGGPVGLPLRDISAWLPFGLKLVHAARPARFEAGRIAMRALLSHAVPAWRRMVESVQATTLLRESGHYVAWESEATAQRGMAAWRATDIGGAKIEQASPSEMVQLKQAFNGKPVAALRFEGTAQVADIPKARLALDDAFAQAGGVRKRAKARSIVIEATCGQLVLDDGSTLTADPIVVAAGVGSANLLASVHGKLPLIAERGYHIEAPAPGWPQSLPPVAFEDRSVIVTGFESSLRLAGFTEFSRIESPPDEKKWERLAQHARALGLPFEMSPARWIGARPTLPDYLPAIGVSSVARNIIYCFGHQHLGVTLAPISGELVVALALQQTPHVETAAFSLTRFC